ncbi:TPA: late promoter activating protein [Klebsiella variicola subsp. variicola]|nr:late promoter activating protein [Klebsiella variicola subsp. variicola]
MGQISSAEIADIMLRQDTFLTVTEVTRLAVSEYPHLHVTRDRVTNIIRHFVRSTRALCESEDGAYPHRYRLHGLYGYQFKVRGRTPDYAHLVVDNTSKASQERAECQRRELVGMANRLWNSAVSNRRAGE